MDPEKNAAAPGQESVAAAGDSIPVESMDDAALDKALATPPAEPAAAEKPNEPAKASDSQPTPPPAAEKQPAGQEKTGEDVPAPSPEADPIKTLTEQIEALKKRVGDKEQFIQRQGREIGDLRKQLQARRAQLSAEAEEIDNPHEQFRKFQEVDAVDAKIVELDAEERYNANKQAVLAATPGFESMIEDVAALAAEDGAPKELIESFKKAPYHTSPQLLLTLARRAEMRKSIKALEGEVEKLRKQPDPGKMAKAIEAAAKEQPKVNAGGGTPEKSGALDGITENTVADLSDAELEELLSKAK